MRRTYNVNYSGRKAIRMVLYLLPIHILLSLCRTHSNMEFLLQIDNQLQGMYQSGCGSANEAPNTSHCFFCKSLWSKLVSQILMDCFVINICHMIVSLPYCCIFLLFLCFIPPFDTNYHPSNQCLLHSWASETIFFINQVWLNLSVLVYFMWLINESHVSFQMLFVTCI